MCLRFIVSFLMTHSLLHSKCDFALGIGSLPVCSSISFMRFRVTSPCGRKWPSDDLHPALSGVFIHKPHGPVVQSVLASSYAVRADNIGNFLHFSCVLCRWSHTEMAKALWPIPFKTLNVAFLRQIWHQIFSMWFRWTLFIINSECENCQSGIEMPHWQASVKAGFVLSSSPSSLCVNAD